MAPCRAPCRSRAGGVLTPSLLRDPLIPVHSTLTRRATGYLSVRSLKITPEWPAATSRPARAAAAAASKITDNNETRAAGRAASSSCLKTSRQVAGEVVHRSQCAARSRRMITRSLSAAATTSVVVRRFFVSRSGHAGDSEWARILNEERPWVAELLRWRAMRRRTRYVESARKRAHRDEDDLSNNIRNVRVTNCDSVNCSACAFDSFIPCCGYSAPSPPCFSCLPQPAQALSRSSLFTISRASTIRGTGMNSRGMLLE